MQVVDMNAMQIVILVWFGGKSNSSEYRSQNRHGYNVLCLSTSSAVTSYYLKGITRILD